MPSERVQRHIERLLDEADQAIAKQDWDMVQSVSHQVLAFDEANADARSFLEAAQRMLGAATGSGQPAGGPARTSPTDYVRAARMSKPPVASTPAEALVHQDFTVGELREMRMQPALERAAAQGRAQGVSASGAVPDGHDQRVIECRRKRYTPSNSALSGESGAAASFVRLFSPSLVRCMMDIMRSYYAELSGEGSLPPGTLNPILLGSAFAPTS